jgi:hypothetical protein
MGVLPEVSSSWIVGKSLLRENRNSLVSVRSNQTKPTREMVLVNRSHKAWIEVEDEDFYHSHSLTLNRFTDLNDQTVDSLCDRNQPENCRQTLLRDFSDAMHELYPSLETP